MRQLKTTFTVIGAVTVLVLATNTVALATTGHALLLGKGNSANAVTAITRTTSGSALKLQTASSANSPLIVNGTGKVANLNADKVDGFDSSVMLNKTTTYSTAVNATSTNGFNFSTPKISSGSYMVTVKGWIYGPNTGPPSYLNCYARITGALIEQLLPLNASGYYTLAISGVLTLPTSDYVVVECDGPSGNYTTYDQDIVQLTLTKIGAPVTGSFVLGKVRVPRSATTR